MEVKFNPRTVIMRTNVVINEVKENKMSVIENVRGIGPA